MTDWNFQDWMDDWLKRTEPLRKDAEEPKKVSNPNDKMIDDVLKGAGPAALPMNAPTPEQPKQAFNLENTPGSKTPRKNPAAPVTRAGPFSVDTRESMSHLEERVATEFDKLTFNVKGRKKEGQFQTQRINQDTLRVMVWSPTEKEPLIFDLGRARRTAAGPDTWGWNISYAMGGSEFESVFAEQAYIAGNRPEDVHVHPTQGLLKKYVQAVVEDPWHSLTGIQGRFHHAVTKGVEDRFLPGGGIGIGEHLSEEGKMKMSQRVTVGRSDDVRDILERIQSMTGPENLYTTPLGQRDFWRALGGFVPYRDDEGFLRLVPVNQTDLRELRELGKTGADWSFKALTTGLDKLVKHHTVSEGLRENLAGTGMMVERRGGGLQPATPRDIKEGTETGLVRLNVASDLEYMPEAMMYRRRLTLGGVPTPGATVVYEDPLAEQKIVGPWYGKRHRQKIHTEGARGAMSARYEFGVFRQATEEEIAGGSQEWVRQMKDDKEVQLKGYTMGRNMTLTYGLVHYRSPRTGEETTTPLQVRSGRQYLTVTDTPTVMMPPAMIEAEDQLERMAYSIKSGKVSVKSVNIPDDIRQRFEELVEGGSVSWAGGVKGGGGQAVPQVVLPIATPSALSAKGLGWKEGLVYGFDLLKKKINRTINLAGEKIGIGGIGAPPKNPLVAWKYSVWGGMGLGRQAELVGELFPGMEEVKSYALKQASAGEQINLDEMRGMYNVEAGESTALSHWEFMDVMQKGFRELYQQYDSPREFFHKYGFAEFGAQDVEFPMVPTEDVEFYTERLRQSIELLGNDDPELRDKLTKQYMRFKKFRGTDMSRMFVRSQGEISSMATLVTPEFPDRDYPSLGPEEQQALAAEYPNMARIMGWSAELPPEDRTSDIPREQSVREMKDPGRAAWRALRDYASQFEKYDKPVPIGAEGADFTTITEAEGRAIHQRILEEREGLTLEGLQGIIEEEVIREGGLAPLMLMETSGERFPMPKTWEAASKVDKDLLGGDVPVSSFPRRVIGATEDFVQGFGHMDTGLVSKTGGWSQMFSLAADVQEALAKGTGIQKEFQRRRFAGAGGRVTGTMGVRPHEVVMSYEEMRSAVRGMAEQQGILPSGRGAQRKFMKEAFRSIEELGGLPIFGVSAPHYARLGTTVPFMAKTPRMFRREGKAIPDTTQIQGTKISRGGSMLWGYVGATGPLLERMMRDMDVDPWSALVATTFTKEGRLQLDFPEDVKQAMQESGKEVAFNTDAILGLLFGTPEQARENIGLVKELGSLVETGQGDAARDMMRELMNKGLMQMTGAEAHAGAASFAATKGEMGISYQHRRLFESVMSASGMYSKGTTAEIYSTLGASYGKALEIQKETGRPQVRGFEQMLTTLVPWESSEKDEYGFTFKALGSWKRAKGGDINVMRQTITDVFASDINRGVLTTQGAIGLLATSEEQYQKYKKLAYSGDVGTVELLQQLTTEKGYDITESIYGGAMVGTLGSKIHGVNRKRYVFPNQEDLGPAAGRDALSAMTGARAQYQTRTVYYQGEEIPVEDLMKNKQVAGIVDRFQYLARKGMLNLEQRTAIEEDYESRKQRIAAGEEGVNIDTLTQHIRYQEETPRARAALATSGATKVARQQWNEEDYAWMEDEELFPEEKELRKQKVVKPVTQMTDEEIQTVVDEYNQLVDVVSVAQGQGPQVNPITGAQPLADFVRQQAQVQQAPPVETRQGQKPFRSFVQKIINPSVTRGQQPPPPTGGRPSAPASGSPPGGGGIPDTLAALGGTLGPAGPGEIETYWQHMINPQVPWTQFMDEESVARVRAQQRMQEERQYGYRGRASWQSVEEVKGKYLEGYYAAKAQESLIPDIHDLPTKTIETTGQFFEKPFVTVEYEERRSQISSGSGGTEERTTRTPVFRNMQGERVTEEKAMQLLTEQLGALSSLPPEQQVKAVNALRPLIGVSEKAMEAQKAIRTALGIEASGALEKEDQIEGDYLWNLVRSTFGDTKVPGMLQPGIETARLLSRVQKDDIYKIADKAVRWKDQPEYKEYVQEKFERAVKRGIETGAISPEEAEDLGFTKLNEEIKKTTESMKNMRGETEKLTDAEKEWRDYIEAKRSKAEEAVFEGRKMMEGASRIQASGIPLDDAQETARKLLFTKGEALQTAGLRGLESVEREEELGPTDKTFGQRMRKVLGGFGLFYATRLVGLGLEPFKKGWEAQEQYRATLAQEQARLFGAGVSPAFEPLQYAQQRTALLSGGGAFGTLQRLYSGMGGLSEFAGAGLTGISMGALASHFAPAFGKGASEWVEGKGAPWLTAGVTLGMMALTQISNAQDYEGSLVRATAQGMGGFGSAFASGWTSWGPAMSDSQKQIDSMLAHLQDMRAEQIANKWWKPKGLRSLEIREEFGDELEDWESPELFGEKKKYLTGQVELVRSGLIPTGYFQRKELPEISQISQVLGMQPPEELEHLPAEIITSGAMAMLGTTSRPEHLVRTDITDVLGVVGQALQAGVPVTQMAQQVAMISGTGVISTGDAWFGAEPIARMSQVEQMRAQAGLALMQQTPGALREMYGKSEEQIIQEAGTDWEKVAGGQYEEYFLRARQNQELLRRYGIETDVHIKGYGKDQQWSADTEAQVLDKLKLEEMQISSIGALTSMGVGAATAGRMVGATAEAGGYAGMHFLQRLTSFSPTAIGDYAQALYAQGQTGLAGEISQYAVTGYNLMGEQTGLGLWATSLQQGTITGEQNAANIWGANWMQSTNALAATYGINTQTGQVYGSQAEAQTAIRSGESVTGGARSFQYRQFFINQRAQQASIGAQWAGIALRERYMPLFWDIEDRQRALQYQSQELGWRQQEWGFSQQERSMEMQGRQWSESFGLQRRQAEMQRGWAMEDWGYQDLTRSLQWGWKQEDFAENIRFMTGRQRRVAERQMERETTMFNLETGQIETQRERQKEIWALEDERFDMQKRHYEEQRTFQEEALAKQRQFFEEGKALQLEMRRLEEESIELNRRYQKEQLEIQKAQLAAQAQAAKEQEQLNKDILDFQSAQEDVMGNYNLMKEKEVELINLFIRGFQHLGQEWDKLIESMVSGKTYNPTYYNPGGGGGGGGGGEHEMYQEGGDTFPGMSYIVGEAGWERVRPTTLGSVVNKYDIAEAMSTEDKWQSRSVFYPKERGVGGSSPQTINLYVGNEKFASFILNTVKRDLEVI